MARKFKTFTLVAALVLSIVYPQQAAAKSNLRLNHKKVTLKVGKSVKLKVKGTKKKVTWKTSKKKLRQRKQERQRLPRGFPERNLCVK